MNRSVCISNIEERAGKSFLAWRCRGLGALALFLAWAGRAALPGATVAVEPAGISASFAPSALAGRNMTVPQKALFYSGKTPVGGTLSVALAPTAEGRKVLRENPEWFKTFQLVSVVRMHAPTNAVNEPFQGDEVEVVWETARPPQTEEAAVAAVDFSLRRRGDKAFPPGLYLLMWGFQPTAPFTVATRDRNVYWVVSRVETEEDNLNWHEGTGDNIFLAPLPANLSPEQKAKRYDEQLETAARAYEQFLALRSADDRVLLKLADIHERLGQRGTAARYLREAAQDWERRQALNRVVAWQGLATRHGNTWRDFAREVRAHADRLEAAAQNAK